MKSALVSVTILASALPALAQDAPGDWNLTINRENRQTIALTAYDNGIVLAARCEKGVFQTLIGGLPEAPPALNLLSSRRTLKIGFGDEPPRDHYFMLGANRTVAFSELPSSLAREMRKGGRMTIVVEGAGEGGRNLRYVLDLPASNTAIDQALADCRRPLADPHDAQLSQLTENGLPANIAWKRPPRGTYPAGRTYMSGFAVILCLSQPDGRLKDCMVETEMPVDGGFGDTALRATRNAVLENKDGGPVPISRVTFRMNYQMEGTSDSPPTGTRLGS